MKKMLSLTIAFSALLPFVACKPGTLTPDPSIAVVNYAETADFGGVQVIGTDGVEQDNAAGSGFYVMFTVESVDNSNGTGNVIIDPANFYVLDQNQDAPVTLYMVSTDNTPLQVGPKQKMTFHRKFIMQVNDPTANMQYVTSTYFYLIPKHNPPTGSEGFIVARDPSSPKSIYSFAKPSDLNGL